MKMTNELVLGRSDFERLLSLAASAEPFVAAALDEELNRAVVVEDDARPADIVSMNSTVAYFDGGSGANAEITLVYPHEADVDKKRISVLTPLGAALIGLRVGQSIHWRFPNGREKELKIVSVRSAGRPAGTDL